MEKIIKLSLLVIALLLFSCDEETNTFLNNVKPGYSSDFSNSSGTVKCSREYNPTIVLYDVDVDLEIVIKAYTDIQKILVMKNLINSENETVASALAFESSLDDTLKVSINSEEELMEGFIFEPDSIQTGYYFTFETFAVLLSNDTLQTATLYQLLPVYLNFCTLPEIPAGVYEAHNRITGFKKNVELRKGVWIYGWIWNVGSGAWELGWTYNEDYYMLTDFGLDWGSWNDWWFGTVFTINCPKPGDTRFVINLPGDGFDTNEDITMIDRVTGENAVKKLRLMPYIYQSTTQDIGYFDASSNILIFKNVAVDDNWWHLDKHTISDVSFTFKPGK